MKTRSLIALFVITFLSSHVWGQTIAEEAKFASLEKARELLLQEDDYTKKWSQFDIDSRMQKPNSSKEELFTFITKQTREWSTENKNKIISILKRIDELILKHRIKIDLPDEIYFIKTTLAEEGGAQGYTRASYIVLKDELLSQTEDQLISLIVHELFHVLTRNNANFRKKMYEIIGFQLMNSLEYPDNLKALRITNPDAPQTDSYLRLKVNGKPKECMMILYSKKDYTGGSFFEYLNVGFLSLTGETNKNIEMIDGQPVIFSMDQVTGFYEQVGKNTKYIIHPEEILADNFMLAILEKPGLPNTDLIDKILKKLQQ